MDIGLSAFLCTEEKLQTEVTSRFYEIHDRSVNFSKHAIILAFPDMAISLLGDMGAFQLLSTKRKVLKVAIQIWRYDVRSIPIVTFYLKIVTDITHIKMFKSQKKKINCGPENKTKENRFVTLAVLPIPRSYLDKKIYPRIHVPINVNSPFSESWCFSVALSGGKV
jgi:hypothetical protein